jgi:hypothetical protein
MASFDERRWMRTAKTCGPGTPGLVLSLEFDELKATVTNKVMDTGESTEKAVNRCAGNAGLFRRTCSDFAGVLLIFAHWAMGAAEHPAFPAPSSFRGRLSHHSGAIRAPGTRCRILRAV